MKPFISYFVIFQQNHILVLFNKTVKLQIKIRNGCSENSENFREPLFCHTL